jgi:hypothetical protein
MNLHNLTVAESAIVWAQQARAARAARACLLLPRSDKRRLTRTIKANEARVIDCARIVMQRLEMEAA